MGIIANQGYLSQGGLMIGASIAWQRGIEWLAVTLMLLNPPVWMDWTWQHAGEPGYLPVVFYIKDVPWNDNAIAVANEFGGVWAIGNEPELQNSFVSPQDAVAFVKKWDDEVGGDPSGAASTIAFTNVTATATGVQAYSYRMNNGSTVYENTGWMKIYVGTSIRYVPYWTSI